MIFSDSLRHRAAAVGEHSASLCVRSRRSTAVPAQWHLGLRDHNRRPDRLPRRNSFQAETGCGHYTAAFCLLPGIVRPPVQSQSCERSLLRLEVEASAPKAVAPSAVTRRDLFLAFEALRRILRSSGWRRYVARRGSPHGLDGRSCRRTLQAAGRRHLAGWRIATRARKRLARSRGLCCRHHFSCRASTPCRHSAPRDRAERGLIRQSPWLENEASVHPNKAPPRHP